LVVIGITALEMSKAWASCPDGYKCIPEEQAKEYADVLDLHNCMIDAAENDEIELNWEPIQITITDDGQVFTQDESAFDLQWCTWQLQMKGEHEVVVNRQEKETDDWGFRLRVKLGAAWLPTYIGKGDVTDMMDPMLLLEPFHLWDWHLQFHAGLKTFGLSLGMDLTNNADVFVGVGLGYMAADVVPALGVSLSFN